MLGSDQVLLQRVGTRLRELRAVARLTQEQVGERAGYSAKYIGEIEKGTRNIRLGTLRAIVESGLGMRLDSVFGGHASRARESAPPSSHPHDVAMMAELMARLPLGARRPLLELVKRLVGLLKRDGAKTRTS